MKSKLLTHGISVVTNHLTNRAKSEQDDTEPKELHRGVDLCSVLHRNNWLIRGGFFPFITNEQKPEGVELEGKVRQQYCTNDPHLYLLDCNLYAIS